MPPTYEPRAIEEKWRRRWDDDRLYHAPDDDARPKWYALTMYPYPSGDLHIGHWYSYAPHDAYTRFMRMRGRNVMSPMGFDAFGLPAENAAIKHGAHPPPVDDGEHRADARPAPHRGHDVRLGPRDRLLPAGVLPLEPVVLPQVL